MKVCHMTSAHPAEDVRIFHKECTSLASNGYDVYLVEEGDSYEKNRVHIIGFGSIPSSRIKRMMTGAKTVYRCALSLDCDVYHFHDPELLPYGLKLKKMGKKVIFDSHEDVPAQIVDKTWIPKLLRNSISKIYKAYESYVVKRLDAVVVATSHIGESFKGRCKKYAVVNNYPRLDDIVFHDTPFSERDAIICYAGGIDCDRGENIMLEAMKTVQGELIIAGDHEKTEVGGNVKYVGRLNRNGINELYGKAIAGLCILKPINNYFYSKPIKVYEYMAAGLPYICSDFPGWKKVAEESGAGICVNPEDVESISNTISMLLNNPDIGQEKGRKGRKYVLENCNWDNEEKRLLSLYREL